MTDQAKPGGQRVAVGYMKGRGGGSTRDAGETIAELQEQFASLRAAIDVMEAQAVGIERSLEAVGRTLERSQPPMWHRVLLRWWKARGGASRVPMFIREERSGGERSVKPTIVGPGVKLRRDAGFGLCADIAAEAVRSGRGLLELRRELMEQLADLKRVAGRGAKRRDKVVGDVQERMGELREEAVSRLRAVGYDLPGEAPEGKDP